MLSGFPSNVKKDLGYDLHRLQIGELPFRSRAMPSVGAKVFELKTEDLRAWYRVIYLSKIGDTIHVLHAFEKKTRKTSPRDLETARRRLKEVMRRQREGKS